MRFTFDRDFYLPKGHALTQVDAEGTDATVYTYENGGRLLAIGFAGKAAKPTFHFRFQTEDRRAKYVASFIEGRKARAKAAAERKAERSQPHTLKVGDILVASWGYEQTNIDFYEVVQLKGKTGVVIRELAQDREETGWLRGNCKPIPGKYVSEPTVKRANAWNGVSFSSYKSAHKWDGRSHYWSSYA